jgi:hypothetical protein
MTEQSRCAGPSRGLRLIHHNRGCEDVCGQAGCKENLPGRGEALRRPASNVHRHNVRGKVAGADLFCITNTNNVCCITVIKLIHICFVIKLDVLAVRSHERDIVHVYMSLSVQEF